MLKKFLDFFRHKDSASDSKTLTVTGKDWINDQCDNENLVSGKNTWELAHDKKHDLEIMKQCCEATIIEFQKLPNMAPAPYYFERVAILSRKNKDFETEIEYCETYIRMVDQYMNETKGEILKLNKSPTYLGIVKRLPKAKDLLKKSNLNNS